MVIEQRPVGLTKTQGWEIGIRRTLPASPEQLWRVLLSVEGIKCWLGELANPDFHVGSSFTTIDGTYGEIRSYNEGSLIRMIWQPQGMAFPSTLQIRIKPTKSGATLSIHHEKLRSQDQREAMHKHWGEVIDSLEKLIGES